MTRREQSERGQTVKLRAAALTTFFVRLAHKSKQEVFFDSFSGGCLIYGASSLLRALYNLAFPPTLHHLEFLEILSSQVRMNGVSQKSQKLRNTSCHSLRILFPYLGLLNT